MQWGLRRGIEHGTDKEYENGNKYNGLLNGAVITEVVVGG